MASERVSAVSKSMKAIAILLPLLSLACEPDVMMLQEQQVYEIDWSPVVIWGLCDDYLYDDPDTIYVPTSPNGPDCNDPPEYPTQGVLQGRVQCDSRPERGLFLASDFYHELHTGGEAWAELTVEGPGTSAIPCYLRYEGTVTEI